MAEKKKTLEIEERFLEAQDDALKILGETLALLERCHLKVEFVHAHDRLDENEDLLVVDDCVACILEADLCEAMGDL